MLQCFSQDLKGGQILANYQLAIAIINAVSAACHGLILDCKDLPAIPLMLSIITKVRREIN